MKNLKKTMSLIAGAGAAVVMAPQAVAEENPFALSHANGAAIVVAEGEQKSISVLEGKCGSGRCGSQRVRQMIDRNADGKINRDEYVSWAAAQAGNEFDNFSKGGASVGVDAVYEHFRSLDYHDQG